MKHGRGMILTAGLCAAFITGIASAGTGSGQPPTFVERAGVMELSGYMIAKPLTIAELMATGLTQQQATARRAMAEFRIADMVDEYQPIIDYFVIRVPAGTTENRLARQLMTTGDYEYIEPDWTVYPVDRCPNDTFFNSQWHHTKIRSCAAWDLETGDPLPIVAICDTGCDLDHSDLAGNRVSGYNAPNRRAESAGGLVADIMGHGTNTAGTAAAIGNNANGVSGVGWGLRHQTIRVTNSSGGGAFQTDINDGALWAAGHGAKICSISYSGCESSSVASLGTSLRSMGVLLVYAAGNETRRLDQRMHDADKVIVVGSTNSSDSKSSFSNYGNILDCVAPGEFIYTTSWTGGYASVSGTSFSCPMTAGLAALIWSLDPSLTADEVEQLIYTGCDDRGTPGWDIFYGYGRINSFNSLTAAGGPQLEIAISPDPLHAGVLTTVTVSNGDPNTLTGAFYSLSGLGSTFIAGLNVTLNIGNAVQIGNLKNSNGAGVTVWSGLCPNPGVIRDVWFQGAQATGAKTAVYKTLVFP